MKSFKDIASFTLKEAGEEQCETCGATYKVYETPKGILGACKVCVDNELRKSLKLPNIEDLEKEKIQNFIQQFEKVTSDLLDVTVNSYKPKDETQKQARNLISDFITSFDGKRSIVLSGTPGLGKSHLAYAAVKAIRNHKKKHALFIKTTHLLDKIKSTYHPNSNMSEEMIFDMLDKLDLLVLDDLGSEYVKQNEAGYESWASDVLYKIFDFRIEKSTICTTNYTESELLQKYGNNGPRIISRMLNKTSSVRLKGEDFRRQERF